MLAVTFAAPFAVDCRSVAEPKIEDPRDAIVAVDASAICGSDLHVFRGVERGLDPGTILGHEFVGTIAEVGPGVEHLRIGMRVASPFSASCGSCWFCRRDLTCRCEHSALFGWVAQGAGLHGAQAERVRVPFADTTLVPLADHVTAEHALLAGDVLSTGLFAADLGAIQTDDVVVVLGCGPVGICAAVGAKARGARAVIAVDRIAERLDFARAHGAAPAHLDEDLEAVVRRATDGRGADVVIEAVGYADATALAWRLVRPGGTISVPGVHNEPQFALTPGQIYDKNLTYRSGRAPARAYLERALTLLARGEHRLEGLFSHRLALAEAAAGYAMFDARRDGCTKVLLTTR
ncbi:MAG: 2-deoxy-scyllo-inosamine dehydrogenase [Planctomycetota bacterium]|jgi:threonine dehydrogenase-like Zn-dependent dehydrogenase